MATVNEASPCEELNKFDPIPRNDNAVRSLNRLFPKIDNLEYFPLKVLLQIFASVDDIGLLNLAENNTRFENIAKMVLNERYTNEYLTVYWLKYDSQRYQDIFNFFGSEIKSIKVEAGDLFTGNGTRIIPLLNRTNNLEKLELAQRLMSKGKKSEYFLQKHVRSSITHLTFRTRFGDSEKGFVLSKFRNLKKLELIDYPCISFKTLKEVIHNNPELESLCIINNDCKFMSFGYVDILRVYPFDKLTVLLGAARLSQLKEFAYIPLLRRQNRMPDAEIRRQPDHIVTLYTDAFVDSLQHLESLALSFAVVNIFTDVIKLLHRLALQCKNIKYLKLYHINDAYDKTFKAISLFKRIECLGITMYDPKFDLIVLLVEKLPLLNYLYVGWYVHEIDWSFVLLVISKCSSLEKFTIASEDLNCGFEIFTTAQFFADFSNCIQMRNVMIEVIYKDRILGIITKDQVSWRNKLLHWVGYDPSRNLSQVHLFDLANGFTMDSKIGQQRNSIDPFDMILGYLDLHSLQSLHKTNEKCSQLVDRFVKQHSQQQGTFIITNEFFTQSNSDYKRLDKFTEYVISLRVNIYHQDVVELRNMIGQFDNLNKLYVYATGKNQPTDLIVPHVRHLIFDGRYFQDYAQLYELSCLCPDLEILELKQNNLRNQNLTVNRLAFRKLVKMTYRTDFYKQGEQIQAIFKDTNTKLETT